MADTVNLARVDFTDMNDKINFIVEKDFELKRFSIADIDVGGEISIDLSTGTSSNANPINADTLNGYDVNYFASQNNLDEAIENIDNKITDEVNDAIENINNVIVDKVNDAIGNINISSTIELNYSVIGGLEEPSEPTENMIWVQTDEIIDNYVMSVKEPKNLQENLIWLKLGSTGNITFGRIKLNNIILDEVNIVQVKQYKNNQWIEKQAKIYQNNNWLGLMSIVYELKWMSSDNKLIQFCASASGSSTSSDKLNIDVSYSPSGYIVLNRTTSWNGFACVYTNDEYDLSEINKIYCKTAAIGTGSVIRFGVGLAESYAPVSAITLNSDNTEYILDVSALTGKYRIGFYGPESGASDWTWTNRNIQYIKYQ